MIMVFDLKDEIYSYFLLMQLTFYHENQQEISLDVCTLHQQNKDLHFVFIWICHDHVIFITR
jgi:hypothetical protein